MKSFCVRVINAVVIVFLLCGYNVTVHAREKADEIARLDAELQNTKIQMANAQAAGNDSQAGQGENTANGDAQNANSVGKYKDGTWQGCVHLSSYYIFFFCNLHLQRHFQV